MYDQISARFLLKNHIFLNGEVNCALDERIYIFVIVNAYFVCELLLINYLIIT